MNITRRQLRKLIYEVLQEDKNNPIIPNSNKRVLDIPDRFRDKQHVESWLKDSMENVGLGRDLTLDVEDSNVMQLIIELERVFLQANPKDEKTFAYYNDFAKKAISAGVDAGKFKPLKTRKQRKAEKKKSIT